VVFIFIALFEHRAVIGADARIVGNAKPKDSALPQMVKVPIVIGDEAVNIGMVLARIKSVDYGLGELQWGYHHCCVMPSSHEMRRSQK
jgi:hypothetical protein